MSGIEEIKCMWKLCEETKNFTKHILSTGSTNDDLGAHRGDPNFDTGVPVFSEIPSQNLIEFCIEDSIRNKLFKFKIKESILEADMAPASHPSHCMKHSHLICLGRH